jgi:hypothetical protein
LAVIAAKIQRNNADKLPESIELHHPNNTPPLLIAEIGPY